MSDISGLHIVVVGLNYAPEPTGSAPYTAGLAEMLAAAGAKVEAIVGVPHYPAWAIDPDYRWTLRKRVDRNGVDVRHVRHFVPHRQSAVARMVWDGTFVANAGLVRPRRRPDVVIASTPSLGGAVVGARLARKTGAGFGVIVQDLVGAAARQSGIKGGDRVADIVARVEGRMLRQADSVSIVSPAFRSHLAGYGVDDARVNVFRNWTHIARATSDRAAARRLFGWGDDEFIVLHTGNMGLKQDLGNVIAAARLLRDESIRIVLCGDGNQRAPLAAQARDAGNVEFLAPVDAAAYPDLLRAADLLLVNERASVSDMALPSKLTSYFSAGRPVLAAISPGGACDLEISGTGGAGVTVASGDPAGLAGAMERLRHSGADLDRMGALGSAYFERELGEDSAAERARALVAHLASIARSRPSR